MLITNLIHLFTFLFLIKKILILFKSVYPKYYHFDCNQCLKINLNETFKTFLILTLENLCILHLLHRLKRSLDTFHRLNSHMW